jgi:uncharacterized protein
MLEPNNQEYWIRRLNLQPHPEGGYYSEVHRSGTNVRTGQGMRSASTSIYFLLGVEDRSVFHRLRSDESWYFHDGDPLELLVIKEKGKLQSHLLGIQDEKDMAPQFTIPAGLWFAARTTGAYTLVGCHVAPGFDFSDFEMAGRSDLLKAYPQHAAMIRRFTHPEEKSR